MASKYLDLTGLGHLWDKIKSYYGNAKIFYGTCSTAAGTTAKAVTCPAFTSSDLVKGAIIFVKFDATNSGAVASLTLNVNGTGAKPIKHYYNGGLSNIPAVGYIHADQTYRFIYDGTNWVTHMTYNTNDNYRSTPYYYYIKPYNTLYRYQVCFTKDEEYILPANSVDNSTGTTKQLTTTEFDPFGPIFFYNSTTNRTNTQAVGACVLVQNCHLDLRYSFNTGDTLTANKLVYVVCDPQTNGKVKLSTSPPPITQDLPTADDGKWYILLGVAYSATNIQMTPNHPVYVFKNGELRTVGGYSLDAAKVNNHTVESDVPSNAKFTDTTYESKTAASGGTAVSLVTTGEKYTWNNKGTGTITGIKMNGSSKGTSGVVDLGTVITAHQDISGKADKSATVSTVTWDSTNQKLTKTINGTASDVVTSDTLRSAINDFYQASPSSNVSCSAGALTQVTLTTTNAVSNGSGFSVSSGGIKITTAGKYRISACVYVTSVATAVKDIVFTIRSGTAFSSSTIIHQEKILVPTQSAAWSGVFCISSKMVSVSANQILFIGANFTGGAGTVGSGTNTYLLVERVA